MLTLSCLCSTAVPPPLPPFRSDTNEVYAGDNTSILKNTSILVKRVPAQRAKTLRIEADSGSAMKDNAGLGARVSGQRSRWVKDDRQDFFFKILRPLI